MIMIWTTKVVWGEILDFRKSKYSPNLLSSLTRTLHFQNFITIFKNTLQNLQMWWACNAINLVSTFHLIPNVLNIVKDRHLLRRHTLVHHLLEECALKSKLVTKFNFLHQNIYAHVMHMITFALTITLKFLQSQTLND